MNTNDLMGAIIDYEVKNGINDTALAFGSHLSVEKIHAMKSGQDNFTNEEVEQVLSYIQTH